MWTELRTCTIGGARIASNGAAHMAVSGILAALIVRNRTGVGQRVDASLYLGLNPIDYFGSYHVQMAHKVATAAPDASPAPDRRVPAATWYMVSACTRDGRWLFFSPQLPHQAKALIKMLELDWLLDDARFADMPTFWTLEDAAAWEDAVYERIKERDLAEWVERALASNDLPFEPVLSAEEALDHPQLRKRQRGRHRRSGARSSRANRTGGCLAADTLGLPALGASARRSPGSPGHQAEARTHHPVTPVRPRGHHDPGVRLPLRDAFRRHNGRRPGCPGDQGGKPRRRPDALELRTSRMGFAEDNEGKESIRLDLCTEGGRKIMQGLLRRANVFVQGFRPGVDTRLGVDYETAKSLNPEIVYVHGSGYGTTGPYADRPNYAGTAASGAGSVQRQAAYWLDPELNKTHDATSSQAIVSPRMRNQTDGDANAAVAVLTAILFGLRHQQRTGEGQFVGTSMLGGNALASADYFNRYAGKRPLPQADPEQLGLSATYRPYEAQEGWLFLALPSQEEWQLAVTAAGRTDLVDDLRFASPVDRAAHDSELARELQAHFRTRPAVEWEAAVLGVGAGCVVAAAGSLAETAVSDAGIREMSLVGEIEHPESGRLLRYAPPVALSATPGRLAPGSLIAQHTASILAELGYGEDEVAKLAADGCVRLAD